MWLRGGILLGCPRSVTVIVVGAFSPADEHTHTKKYANQILGFLELDDPAQFTFIVRMSDMKIPQNMVWEDVGV